MTFWRLSLWIIVPALCIGLGVVLLSPSSDQKPATPVTASPQPAPKTDKPAEVKAELSLTPSFDIVRLEPNGDLVVAGRAGPKAVVTLLMDGKDWDKATTDETGQFAMTPKSLAQGPHQLSLVARMPDGKEFKSAQVVALDVPARGGQAVAALISPDQPAKSLLSTQGMSLAPGQRAPVVITLVETQPNGTFYAAGRAVSGALVRLYLNDSFVAQGGTSPTGEWSFAIVKGLTQGQYRVRIDEMEGAGGKVMSRAEVPFDYTMPAAAQTAPPSPRAAAVEVAEVQSTTVKRGDNLWNISSKFYGEGLRYTVIYQANSGQIRDPNLIYPGQVFVVPKDKP